VPKDKYEVVLETTLYYSVYVDAEDSTDAEDIALEKGAPSFSMPHGFEVDDKWYIGGSQILNNE
jgi:hypothetical protein